MMRISREVVRAMPLWYQGMAELLVKIGEVEIVDRPAPEGKIASLQETPGRGVSDGCSTQ